MSVKVGVLDHGMGNLRSVARALEAAGGETVISDEAGVLASCARLCVPGQGIFGRCVDNLVGSGLDALIRDWIEADRPYLGICLGMQVLFGSSEESPSAGLGILEGDVARLRDAPTLPHIGWNTVEREGGPTDHFYFDHSFAVFPAAEEIVTGWSEHGQRFAASIEMGSVTATQFHPEKSGDAGISMLKGWVDA